MQLKKSLNIYFKWVDCLVCELYLKSSCLYLKATPTVITHLLLFCKRKTK